MSIHEVLFDGVFGDIDLSVHHGGIDIEVFSDKEEYLESMIRGRLKCNTADYGFSKKYNLLGYFGANNSRLESLLSSTVSNMLSFDGLVTQKSLKVSALKRKHEMIIGIKIIDELSLSNSVLKMLVIREENGGVK